MVASEFILRSYHEALKYIQGQYKLNSWHDKWMEYLASFHFTIKFKSGKLTHRADARSRCLSRRHLLLFELDACILGFEHLKYLYDNDEDFGELYKECLRHPNGEFMI